MTESTDILCANLAALRESNPALAARLEATDAAALTWSPSKAGPLTASATVAGRTLSLASKFDPHKEAEKLIGPVDLAKHACVVALGFGVGHHVAAIAAQMDAGSVLIVFEPDPPRLRAALERVDHSRWLGEPWVVVTDSPDRAALLNRLEPHAATLTQGTVLITHPPTRQLAGQALAEFGNVIGEVLAFCRTNVATALVNASRTVSNLTANLPHYAAGATVNELHRAAAGFPAVCVSAGPSLAKNIALLCDPNVRRNVVVITAQTTLKPLLDRGIEPDFVTALDYHEISRRFHEGLPPLERVTLIAEPKVHPAVVDAFPGPIRMTDSGFLNTLLGDLARPRVPMRGGATVAHLSFYLAQHLGCDPIIMIGQDLGFSDGLYYSPGTAIHDVWVPELGPFNTVEMMEWQRIVRHRAHLKKLEDVNGQPIYSDEQMLTYLKQFERDFTDAPQAVIDATEGGLPKQGAQRMTLREALETYATKAVPALPRAEAELECERLDAVAALLAQRIAEVEELRRLSRDTIPILKQMREHQRDRQRFDRLFKRLQKNKRRVDELTETFTLVNELNTIGSFKRLRADRAIHQNEKTGGDAYDTQRRQIDRDLENIDWLLQAYEETLGIFKRGLQRVQDAIVENSADPESDHTTPSPSASPRAVGATDANIASDANLLSPSLSGRG